MILLIHGAGAGGWEWGIWQRAFAAENLATMALDLMPASAGLAHTRYEDYLLQVQQAIAQHQPSVVIAASLGGLLAAEALSMHASPAKLVLLGPAGERRSSKPPQSPNTSSKINRQHTVILNAAPSNTIKRWANDPQLARTARALPDADAASIWFAHSSWRDESAIVLAQALAGRHFEWRAR